MVNPMVVSFPWADDVDSPSETSKNQHGDWRSLEFLVRAIRRL